MNSSNPIKEFNLAWKNKAITKPLVILIGGYAGTGKSTVANTIAQQLDYTQTIPTGIFRSIAQTQTLETEKPALFLPTYDLHKVYGSKQSLIRRAYIEQCSPVTTIISAVVNFMGTEKQHIIIEGNHVLPWEDYSNPNCTVIELYLQVKETDKHRSMLCGPTHNRSIDDTQFKTGRMIHDIIRDETINNAKPLFECTETEAIELYLNQQIQKVLITE